MKLQPFLYGLAATLLLSLACLLPFLPQNRSEGAGFRLEAELRSSQAAVCQVYYDIGRGTSEQDSARQLVPGANQAYHLSLPLPEGEYRSLRFDPLDRGGSLEVRDLCIRDFRGQVLARIKASQIQPIQQVQARTLSEDCVILDSPDKSQDPITFLQIPSRLILKVNPSDTCLWVLEHLMPLWGLLGGGLFLCLHPSSGAWLRQRREALAARPRTAIAVVAALAAMLACYSVLFCGRSFVSPNHGSLLLYDGYPTLPGSTDSVSRTIHGSDIGATMWQTIPYAAVEHQALFGHGELPLWNRMNSSGVTLLGQGQSMIGDPMHLLLPVLFNGAAWAWDLKFVLGRWFFALGIGLVAWRLTRHLPSSLLATVSAAFVGFFIHRFSHPAYANFCYSPWILLGWLGVIQSVPRRERVLSALVCLLGSWGTLTGGAVKEAYMLLLSLHLSGLILLAFSELKWGEKLARLVLLAFTGLCFVLLSAPFWMSFLESLRRAYTSLGQNGVYQIQGGLLLGLFDELFYRPLVANHFVFCPSANLLVLGGVLFFLVSLLRDKPSRLALGLAASTLPAFLLAFGVIPGSWIHAVPFLGVVAHIDNSFSCVLIVLLCALAAPGFHAAWKRLGTPEGRGDLALYLAGLALVVAAYLSFMQSAHRQVFGAETVATVWTWGAHQAQVEPFVWASLWLMVAALVVLPLLLGRARRTGSWSPAALILLVLCCTVLLWRQGLHVGAGFENYVQQPGPRTNLMAKSDALETAKAQAKEPFRIAGVEATLFPGWTGMYGLEGISGPDALMSPHYRALVDALGIERQWDWRLMLHADTLSRTLPALSVLNVRYLVAPAPVRDRLTKQLLLLKTSDLDLYRNESCWPRAFYASRLEGYRTLDELAARLLASPGPLAAVQLGDRDEPAPDAASVAARTVPATGYQLSANTTRFTVDAPAPGYAVLQETWVDREFRAWVDGRKAPWFRVNHAFRAVRIDAPGRHEVRFEYVPRNWLQARILALAGLLLLAGMCLHGLRGDKQRP
jgi:hypothetical protein